MKKVIRIMTALLMAFTGVGVAALDGGVVQAHNSPGATNSWRGNDNGHPSSWDYNGCGPKGAGWTVPDRGWSFDFNHACDHHDGCYKQHWKSRYGCDRTMLSSSRYSCKKMWTRWYNKYKRYPCRAVAYVYYKSVRAFGSGNY